MGCSKGSLLLTVEKVTSELGDIYCKCHGDYNELTYMDVISNLRSMHSQDGYESDSTSSNRNGSSDQYTSMQCDHTRAPIPPS